MQQKRLWVSDSSSTTISMNRYSKIFFRLVLGMLMIQLMSCDKIPVAYHQDEVESVPSPIATEGNHAGESRAFLLPGRVQLEMVWIPAGVFTMGSPSTEEMHWFEEVPLHQVTISQGFWLGKNEITQGQWEEVLGTRPWSGQEFVQINRDHPAVYVSWEDVQEFIFELNLAEGREVYRLPTEAEWEYACRAGTTTQWSFGDDESRLVEYAWYKANTDYIGINYELTQSAQPVGQKLPNPWGLYDMHGNVAEWVQDWYGAYSSEAQIDPMGPLSGVFRVYRGGGFASDPQSTRSAFRIGIPLPPWGWRTADIGARLLKTE